MSKGTVNKVILIGYIGADPEVRHMPSGGQVTSIRIATTESWKDRQTGQQQERTEWHRVVFYQRLAEIVGEYLKKGSKIYVEGSLRTSQYEKNGEKRYSTEIIGNEMQMLDRASAEGAPSNRTPQSQPQGQRQPSPAPAGGGGNYPGEGDFGFDDDIPF